MAIYKSTYGEAKEVIVNGWTNNQEKPRLFAKVIMPHGERYMVDYTENYFRPGIECIENFIAQVDEICGIQKTDSMEERESEINIIKKEDQIDEHLDSLVKILEKRDYDEIKKELNTFGVKAFDNLTEIIFNSEIECGVRKNAIWGLSQLGENDRVAETLFNGFIRDRQRPNDATDVNGAALWSQAFHTIEAMGYKLRQE